MSTTTITTTATAPAAEVNLDEYDAEQVALMEERLILLDKDDTPIGEESKKTCHLMENILPPRSLLHRAFSVFLFNPEDGKLLLQKRADEKITFPSLWTNTCCSHPLAIKGEMEVIEQLGVRRAAQRKLQHELGIEPGQVPLDDFVYLTRIHYLAPSDGMWGEHEIDYILFITAKVDLAVNQNECSDVTYVSKVELEAMFKDPKNAFTPWFKLIVNKFLYPWWDQLVEGSAKTAAASGVDAHVLEPIGKAEGGVIHRM